LYSPEVVVSEEVAGAYLSQGKSFFAVLGGGFVGVIIALMGIVGLFIGLFLLIVAWRVKMAGTYKLILYAAGAVGLIGGIITTVSTYGFMPSGMLSGGWLVFLPAAWFSDALRGFLHPAPEGTDATYKGYLSLAQLKSLEATKADAPTYNTAIEEQKAVAAKTWTPCAAPA